MTDFSKLAKGIKLVGLQNYFTDFSYGRRQRLTVGKQYTFDRWDDNGLWITACDSGHNCCWNKTGLDEFFTVVSEDTQ